jgi:hypothetical protein
MVNTIRKLLRSILEINTMTLPTQSVLSFKTKKTKKLLVDKHIVNHAVP